MDMIHCLYAAFMNFRIIYDEIKDFSVGEIVMHIPLHPIFMGTRIKQWNINFKHFF